MPFLNCYEDAVRAEAYSTLEFANTYHLAFRDLPALFHKYVKGINALDFGCGTGRSTRFLRGLGFHVAGVDIAPEMLRKAREIDPTGHYLLIAHDDMSRLPHHRYALILTAFTFDNIPGMDRKVQLFRQLRGLLSVDGVIVNLVSSPEIYVNEWASFSTRDFPENQSAEPGEVVKIVTTDFRDATPALDILWPDKWYRKVYYRAGMQVVEMLKPLATGAEPFAWVNETRIAPWAIYVLKLRQAAG